MSAKHRLQKFHGFPNRIRWEITPPVAFIVSGAEISVVQDPIDFDGESDLIVERIKGDSPQKTKYAFEYRIGSGFEEVDANSQKWFDFC